MKSNQANKRKSVIQKIIDDKRTIREYIRKHGSLKGFDNSEIKLSKPI